MDVRRICLDPGHGGIDAGGSSRGVSEATLNLKVAIAVRDKLALMSDRNTTFEVFFTRSSPNENPSLTARGMHAVYNKCELFVSIHHNANQGASRGYEVIPAYHSGAEKLAKIYAEEFSKHQKICRGVWQRPSEKRPGEEWYTVIDVAEDHDIPAVITEYAYLDNTEDYNYAASDTGVAEQVNAHCATIYRFLTGKEFGVSAEEWKVKEVQKLLDSGLLTDSAWLSRVNDNVPIWMLATTLNRIKKAP